MSAKPLRFLVVFAAGLLLVLGAGRAQAQKTGDSDLADQAKRAASVAAQKTEGEIRSAVLDAQKLFPTDRARAIGRLKKALALLDDDTTLSDSRRASLQHMLRDRIRVFETDAARAVEKEDEKAERKAADRDRRAEEDRRAAEEKIIQRNIDTVRELQKEGRTEDARQVARKLAARYPGNKEVQALIRSMSRADQAAEDRRLRSDKERRVADAMRDVDRAALPPRGDIDFGDPKRWREISKIRLKATSRLTPKEEAILRAMATPVRVNFKDSQFKDVIETLSTMIGQPILVDEEALRAAQINTDTTITLPLKSPVAARTILRKILNDLGLAYVIKDEVIQVVTPEKAKTMMITRAYPVADLVAGGQAGFVFGPGVQQLEMLQRARMIMDMITSTIDPPSWRANGGEGTISFEPTTLSLVIKQSAEVHSMIGSAFR
jgi:hypothetical protein